MPLSLLTPFGNGGVRPALPVNPFGLLQREIDRLFENFMGGSGAGGQAQATLVPSTDVIETDTDILITAEMPGLQRSDVDITITDNVLTIRGEKRLEHDQAADKNKKYQLSERSYGVFSRSLQLPAGIEGFAASSKHVSPETVSQLVSCGSSMERHLETIGRYVRAGYDHIILVQVGREQDLFIDFFENKLAPALTSRKAA